MPRLKAQIVVKTELTFSEGLYSWVEPHLPLLLDRRPSENVFTVARSVIAGAESLLETFDAYRQAVTSALGIDPKSCIEDVVEAIQKFNLAIKDGQLYKNGELVTRGDDDDPSVVAIDYNVCLARDELWHGVSVVGAYGGIIAYVGNEDTACLFAQIFKATYGGATCVE